MIRRRTLSLVAAALIGSALILGACGGSSDPAADATGDAVAAPSGDKPAIKIVQNAWTASALEAELAKQVIEANLGNKVEIVTIDENAMFAGLSAGDVDAVLEIWPSGVTADEQKFLDDGSVTNMGLLGTVGKIGWWVPDYMIEQNPSLASSEGLADPAIAKLFATAETGDRGRFLGTDPSYSQYDEAIVKNLNLPFDVKYSGSEAATVAEIDARVAKKEPVLLYWWTPTAAVAKYNLKNVTLPAHTPECYADPAKANCDYPEDPMFKAASAKLSAKDAAVFAFIQKFTLSTDDQLAMLPAVEIDKRPAADVAKEWIAANPDKVKAWLAG
jgi:glycine betaine/proline transport system substrate-binding protein